MGEALRLMAAMKADLDTLRRFPAAPFMVDLGVEPVAVGEGTGRLGTMGVAPMNR
jgi:hypothetical protein